LIPYFFIVNRIVPSCGSTFIYNFSFSQWYRSLFPISL